MGVQVCTARPRSQRGNGPLRCSSARAFAPGPLQVYATETGGVCHHLGVGQIAAPVEKIHAALRDATVSERAFLDRQWLGTEVTLQP